MLRCSENEIEIILLAWEFTSVKLHKMIIMAYKFDTSQLVKNYKNNKLNIRYTSIKLIIAGTC